jgi:2-(1,2-epoxy-1,2-dihydrophenyl)acetyl-CoA isomerase
MSSTTLDTGTPELLATLDEGVLTLTFNRPDARNALSREVNQALQVQLAGAESNPAVKCILLTGHGKAFCAGGDVKSMLTRNYNEPGSHTLDEYIHRQRLEQRAISGRLFTMPKPTLAAIPGAAAGAGFSIALACDRSSRQRLPKSAFRAITGVRISSHAWSALPRRVRCICCRNAWMPPRPWRWV